MISPDIGYSVNTEDIGIINVTHKQLQILPVHKIKKTYSLQSSLYWQLPL